jgi:hypothetical protein
MRQVGCFPIHRMTVSAARVPRGLQRPVLPVRVAPVHPPPTVVPAPAMAMVPRLAPEQGPKLVLPDSVALARRVPSVVLVPDVLKRPVLPVRVAPVHPPPTVVPVPAPAPEQGPKLVLPDSVAPDLLTPNAARGPADAPKLVQAVVRRWIPRRFSHGSIGTRMVVSVPKNSRWA